MPENVAPRSGAPAAGPGGRGKSAYQDRDKPAQIRFSNISAAKGIGPWRARAGLSLWPCPGWVLSFKVVPSPGALFLSTLRREREARGHAPSWRLVFESPAGLCDPR